MKDPRSFLIFPLDVPSYKEAISLVKTLGSHVGMFKIGLELFIAEGPNILNNIRNICDAGIFLDLKLHDIPTTMTRAIKAALNYQPDFITVHCEQGNGFLKIPELASSTTKLLGITVLTSISPHDLEKMGYLKEYCENLVNLAILRGKIAIDAGCHGLVCSAHEVGKMKKEINKELIVVTPGIRPAWTIMDTDDQSRIMTPALAISKGADHIVVGRPIRDAEDPATAAKKVVEEIKQALLLLQ